ncbi:Pycsar system effector family protein [Streptomyces sp. NPDC058773]|uniref:Pycsar system effector family protein n=1 Tax=Streptomyces sp. NPDC058773 TaxID=3346632 RepID=UPI0036A0F0DF
MRSPSGRPAPVRPIPQRGSRAGAAVLRRRPSPQRHRQLHRSLRDRRGAGAPPGTPHPETLAAMERFLAANGVEIARADTKAAVLLGFMGAVLGAFLTVTRGAAPGHAPESWKADVLWWGAVGTALLAIVCFVCAIAPRRRRGRKPGPAGPGYFEHIGRGEDGDGLSHAFARIAHDPTGPLLASVRRTSEIIRSKYRWIETGTALLLVALPQFAAALQPG